VEITGFSNDFVVDRSFPDRARRFIEGLRTRWPGLYVNGKPAGQIPDAQWTPAFQPDQEEPEIITFSSGPEMEEFWEVNGYALNESGEGPCSLLYLARAGEATTPPVYAPRLPPEFEQEQYMGAQFLLTDFYLVSLVTPLDPAEDLFSLWLKETFTGSHYDAG
jgi:hypothetical protein